MMITNPIINASPAVVGNVSGIMKSNTNVSLSLCQVTKVDSRRMTADIYLPEISNTVYNVPICFPSKGVGYGSFFMPRAGAWSLAVLANNKRVYLLASTYVTTDESDSQAKERILAGENLIQAIGGAYARQDIIGNQILRSSFGNGMLIRNNGVNTFHANGKEDFTIASKSLSGFGISQNDSASGSLLNSGNVPLINYEEYYNNAILPRVYASDDIISITGDIATINNDVQSAILNDAQQTLDLIYGNNTGIKSLYDYLYQFKTNISNGGLSDEDVQEIYNDASQYLTQHFDIQHSGVKIVIEKGNALNVNPDSVDALSSLQPNDFAKDSDGDNICLRISVVETASSNRLFDFTVDVKGHTRVKAKTIEIIEEGET